MVASLGMMVVVLPFSSNNWRLKTSDLAPYKTFMPR